MKLAVIVATLAAMAASNSVGVGARPMHVGINYARYLKEKEAIADELNAWLDKYKTDAEKNGWMPRAESRNADEVMEDRQQRFFLAKELVANLQKKNPDAEFSTDSPFTLLTPAEFAKYVGNSYIKDNTGASISAPSRGLRTATIASEFPPSGSIKNNDSNDAGNGKVQSMDLSSKFNDLLKKNSEAAAAEETRAQSWNFDGSLENLRKVDWLAVFGWQQKKTPASPAPAATTPTEVSTVAPIDASTSAPTEAPTTSAPTEVPTPTQTPTTAPTLAPTPAPTLAPTPAPTEAPTPAPTPAPTAAPTTEPTSAPTPAPEPVTEVPVTPTAAPEVAPEAVPVPQTEAPEVVEPSLAPEPAPVPEPAEADADEATPAPEPAPEPTPAPEPAPAPTPEPAPAPEPSAAANEDAVIEETPAVAAQNNVDWTTSSCMPPIQSQGQCGSCWSFATIAAIETTKCIVDNTGSFHKLSEQNLASCSSRNHGCDGGVPVWAMQHIMANGVCSEQDDPYTAENGRLSGCNSGCAKSNQGVKSIGRAEDEASLLKAVSRNPVVVAVASGNEAWKQYKGGVLSSCDSSQVDHAVVVVGYDDTTLKIRNSWGESWGDNGYVRLRRTTAGKGTCEVLTDMTWVQF